MKSKIITFVAKNSMLVDLPAEEIDIASMYRKFKKSGEIPDPDKIDTETPYLKINMIKIEVPEMIEAKSNIVTCEDLSFNQYATIFDVRKTQVKRGGKGKSGSLFTGRVKIIRKLNETMILEDWIREGCSSFFDPSKIRHLDFSTKLDETIFSTNNK